MKNSVDHIINDDYKITITSESEGERMLLEKPISEIKERVFQYFDQAVKDKFGEKASIGIVKDKSGLPYEIIALISLEKG